MKFIESEENLTLWCSDISNDYTNYTDYKYIL